ncbi:MAG: tetratricopeptide repeat protein [Gammaproteobacteria bacterium]|jgi:TolB-like protein/Tfp pilus assembly protein PilF
MSKLELILLGRFECLLSSGKRVTLAMRKAEVLLAYLALSPGLRHPRERLINLLWSDRGEEQARNSLRQCLSAIRKSLGEAADLALQIDRTSVCLNAGIVEVDVHEFERLAAAGEYESLVTAADLYQGEFLEGISIRDAACQEWLDSERGRFRRQFIEILFNLAEIQLVSHDYANAIRSAERLVEQDPLHETGWRLLMQSYADNGDRGHALQAFKRCQQILRSELDVDPETATIELRDAIAGGKSERPVARPATTESANARASGAEHSIAVLPFDNLSGDPQQEYFSDGITDSIIMNLALFPDLRVKSRNSSFAFKEQIKSLGEISRELGVAYIVEGSVRRSSGRIRVNVQLIESESGNQVWGKRYDADLDDLFELEDDLSRSIAATVTGKIESELQRIALAKGATDQQAYDLLLAGIYHVQRGNRKDNNIAIEKLNACLERDPDNARAHAWLYDCHHFSIMDRWSEDLDRSRQLAIKHIQRAVELEPEQKTVLLSHIDYLTFQHRYEEAEAQVQRALANNPNEAGAYAARAVNLSSMGQWPEAVEAAEIALHLDPHNYWGLWILAESLFFCDRYEECLETIARTDNAPGFILVYNVAANIELGRPDAARKSLDAFVDFCRENMRTPPRSTGEWRQYLKDNAPFADSAVNERVLDLLLKAGLESRMRAGTVSESVDKDRTSAIAVLPFDNLSGDPEQEYFSDGITESIILNLALFPGLQVKSRNSSFAFKQQLKGLAEISRELDVDYVVEGSVRKAKDRIRITAQLIDAANGNQVWGKRYDADLDGLFELEENLSREIAATVTGRIESELQRIAIAKGAADQQAYDLLLAGMYHVSRFNSADNAIAIEMFERCLAQDPDNVRAHVGLYICYSMAYLGRWIDDYKNSFDMAWKHIRRALQLDPEDRAAQVFLGEMLSFSGELDKARRQIEKVLAVNPSDTDALAVLATIHSFLCDGESALKTAEHALKLDPFHPWAEWELAVGRYYCDDYEGTVDALSTMRAAPGFINLYKVAALVRLERIDEARTALKEFMRECESGMKQIPRDIDEWIQYTRENYPFADAQRNRDLVDTMVQAGLEEMLPGKPAQADAASLPSILVLPFTNQSGDPEQEYFSDGITDSVIVNLSAFPGVRVKSRHASFAFKDSQRDIDEFVAQLGVEYVVEGYIRKAAGKVRITAQLSETASGHQVWGKRFDYDLDDLFALEEELSMTIAGTVNSRVDKEARQRALRKPAKDLRAYDHYMRGSYHMELFTAKDIDIAIEHLEKCLALDADNSVAHAKLGIAHMLMLYENCAVERERSVEAMDEHFKRALELDPNDAEAHAFTAERFMYAKDFDRALVHARKAVELNPTLADGYSMLAWHAGSVGQLEEARAYAEKSLQTDIHHPYAGWNAGEIYRLCGDYELAIQTFRSMAHISTSVHAQIASCLAGLNRIDEARAEMRRYLELAREQMTTVPASREQWYAFWSETMPYKYKEDTDRFFDLLLQAGLCDDLDGSGDDMPSIAVLPFDNMSGDPEQEHFADGITADIISTLSKIRNMRIIARHSTLQYKTEKASIAEIAEQQGVRYILEGSVRKSGDRIRVGAELIDSESGQNCWSERYDRELDDLFAVQDDITKNIVVAMKVYLTDGDRSARRSAGTKNIKAWELALLAIDLQDTYIHQNIIESRTMCQRAIALDPGYCYAWVVLGWTHWQEAYSGWCESFEESMRAAEAAAAKALELEPENGEAWVLAGTIHVMNHEPDKALEASRKALEFEPGNAEVQVLVGFAMNFVGEFDRAWEHFQNAMRLCPVCPNWYYLVGSYCEQAKGNTGKAIELLRRGIAVEPESPLIRFYLASVLLENGDEKEARQLVEEIRQLDDSMTGKGLVQSYSRDAAERDRLQRNFETLGLV